MADAPASSGSPDVIITAVVSSDESKKRRVESERLPQEEIRVSLFVGKLCALLREAQDLHLQRSVNDAALNGIYMSLTDHKDVKGNPRCSATPEHQLAWNIYAIYVHMLLAAECMVPFKPPPGVIVDAEFERLRASTEDAK